MRKFLDILRYVYLAIVAMLLLASLAFALMQTKWARVKIASALSALCDQNGIEFRMGRIEGILPFTWQIENMMLQSGEVSLELDNIKMRFAIWPFINKSAVLSYFNVEKAKLSFPGTYNEPYLSPQELFERLTLPYRIVVQRLKINALTCENQSTHTVGQYFLLADADLGKQMRHLHAHLFLSPMGHLDNALQISLSANARLNEAGFSVKAHLPSLESLSPFYTFSSEESIDLDLSLKGKWTTWSALFNKTTLPSPLLGKCTAELHINSLPLCFWKINAAFGIDTPHSLEVYSSSLTSDVVHISMDGKIEKELAESSIHLQFSLPFLSKLDPHLTGAVQGEMLYAHPCAQLDLHTEGLAYKGYALEPLAVHAVVNTQEEQWTGRADAQGQAGTCGFDFHVEKDQLALSGFSLKGPGVLLAGDLALDTKRTLFTGALYGHADHLRSLFPGLDGSIGIECQLFEEQGKQGLRCFLLGKNSQFKQYTIDQWSLIATVSDVFSQPLGKLQLLAKDVHSPVLDIDLLDLSTASQEEQEWPFSLNLQGTSEDPFSLYAQGNWKKEGPLLSVETTTIAGTLFSSKIQLLEPFLFEIGRNQTFLSPVHMTIGEGSLFASLDLHPKRSVAQMQLEHFPLKLFSLVFPTHTLAGTLNLNAKLDATADNIEGTLNAVLEEASLPHFEEKEPFIAKGSVQAHLDNLLLQTHAYLYATKEQFIDVTATLPIAYDVYPLRLSFEPQAPISAEFIAEGQLQDLFDFINLGIHRASGFISSRLFLSGSLNAPSLVGSIEWEDGAYENFLTGLSLKNINAHLNADRNALELLSFSARDDKKGSVRAEGTIDLNFKEHIPYRFVAELDHLHALQFDPIDCTLSGPLYLSGNLREALAQGNLLVPQAQFTIPDKLPLEIPVLPVTYVNGTYPLSTATLQPFPAFAFRIQLDLTADDHVAVKGKGLNSEWKGMLSLSGTNMSVLANGTLQLVKGEYSIFGKTFKLNEGQIIFNDKPSPSATINLTGNLSLADTVITAHLRGPLSSPTLTFQSNPQLSTSAILARILFNKDISDISQPEAIQLATTLISLSGGTGPSVLEAIRKNIGVDRLAISSQTAHPDEIAVQIGKYLTKGVLITLSQSATSSQVIVEVEFNYGFVFQAETQEEQEGKFSLKWTHSY